MGFYNLTNTFNSLSGDQPAQKLDDNFSQLAVMPLYATLVSGTSDAIALTVPMTFGAYQAGMVFNFIAAATNATSTPTIDVNTIGAKTVVKQNLPLAAADIVANGVYSVYYDGTNFHLFNPSNTNQHQATNVVINGAMNIDQRNAGSAVTSAPSGTYIVDRFSWFKTGIGNADVQQSSAVPSSLTPILKKSILVQVSTIDGTLSGTDKYGIQYAIEGYDTQPMLNTTFTISFYAAASIAGTYCLAVTNSSGNYTYVKEYSLPLANTWYYISITVPNGLVSANFTNLTTSFNAQIVWSLGSAVVGPNAAWNTNSQAYATSNQVNLMGTLNAVFRLSGVQLFQGQSTPEIEPRIFSEEIAACERYYQTSYGAGVAPGTVTGNGQVTAYAQNTGSPLPTLNAPFRTRMRTTPAITWYSPTTGASGQVRNVTSAADVAATTTGIGQTRTGWVGLGTSPSAGDLFYGHWVADADA